MSRYYNDYLQHSDEDTLAHFGIPGMKWGQRKKLPSKLITSRNGDKLYLKNVSFFGRKIKGDYNIYNKLGFKRTGDTVHDEVWADRTPMTYKY